MRHLWHEATSLKNSLERLVPQLIVAAQEVYDMWEQDENGYSEEYGSGGICDNIAIAICDVLSNNRIDCFSQYDATSTHTSAYATDFTGYDFIEKPIEKGIMFQVDIPPHVYEDGFAYTWSKIPDVVFTKQDLFIEEFSWVIGDWFDDNGELLEF